MIGARNQKINWPPWFQIFAKDSRRNNHFVLLESYETIFSLIIWELKLKAAQIYKFNFGKGYPKIMLLFVSKNMDQKVKIKWLCMILNQGSKSQMYNRFVRLQSLQIILPLIIWELNSKAVQFLRRLP